MIRKLEINLENFTLRVSKIFFGAITGIILLFLFFFETVDYSCKKVFGLPDKLMIITAVIIFAAAYVAVEYIKNHTAFRKAVSFDTDKAIKIAVLCLFAIQVYISYNILFETDWDAGIILYSVRGFLAGDGLDEFRQWYFSLYPNNLMLLFYELLVLKINSVFGIFIGQQQLMCMVIINCALSSSACYLVYKIAILYVKRLYATLGFVLAVLSFGLSPWMVICYSDQLGIIFPILSIYFFTKPVSSVYKRTVCLCLSVMISCVGYFIKPQCFIILIAIALVEVLKLFCKNERKEWKRILIVLLSIVFTFLTVRTGLNLASDKYNIHLEPEAKFGMSHFFAMGLNPNERGTYSQEDVDFSASIPTVKERNSANIKKALNRINNMGFKGLVRYYIGKTLTIYNDGTFAWRCEGTFFANVFETPNLKAAPFLRNIYCTDSKSEMVVTTVQQFVWIVILLLSFASVFAKHKNVKGLELAVLMISIVGLTLFELLFEARARYLYIYVPIFCVLAAVGADNMHFLFDKIFRKSQSGELPAAERS